MHIDIVFKSSKANFHVGSAFPELPGFLNLNRGVGSQHLNCIQCILREHHVSEVFMSLRPRLSCIPFTHMRPLFEPLASA